MFGVRAPVVYPGFRVAEDDCDSFKRNTQGKKTKKKQTYKNNNNGTLFTPLVKSQSVQADLCPVLS